MDTKEILLIIAVIVTLVLPQLMIKRTPSPTKEYIQIGAGILFLIFLWIIPSEGTISTKLILTAIGFTGICKSVINLKNLKNKNVVN